MKRISIGSITCHCIHVNESFPGFYIYGLY